MATGRKQVERISRDYFGIIKSKYTRPVAMNEPSVMANKLIKQPLNYNKQNNREPTGAMTWRWVNLSWGDQSSKTRTSVYPRRIN